MLKHVVMWCMKESAEGRSKQENMDEMKKQIQGLVPSIPEIQSMEIGINLTNSPAAYDFIIVSSFAGTSELEVYRNHEKHKEVVAFINKVTEKVAVVDYEVGEA